MEKIKKEIWAVLIVLSITGSLWAGTHQVLSHQKISSTEGNFLGELDDNDRFGINGTSLGDLDGDGVTDIAVGAYLDDDGGIDKGAVWILFLNADGTVKNHQKISDTEGNFNGSLDNQDEFGSSVTALGDFDEDGVVDMAVGAPYDDDGGGENKGCVWILFLNTDGTVKGHQKISSTEGNFTGILDDWDDFGSSVCDLGDLDNDGIPDLAVGAYNDGDGGYQRGAVWILFLNSDGTVKSHQKISDTQGNFTGILDNSDKFGHSVHSLGDIDGDYITDLAVGAAYDDDGGTNRGAVWILFLNTDGTVKNHRKISNTEGGFTGILDDYDSFGVKITPIGDLDNDGVNDIAVGASGNDGGGTDRGAIWILYLNADSTVKGYRKISDTEGNFTGILDDSDRFGHMLVALGDLDKNGVIDIATSSLTDDDGGTDRGAVWVLFLEEIEVVENVLHVDGATGDDNNDGLTRGTAFATIQRGIDKAKDGYTVLVWPGVYNESVYFLNKAITVQSADEPAVIAATGTYAISIYTAEEQTSVLKNFIIRDCDTGIFVSSGSPTLSNLTIVNNNIGIEAWSGANPTITNCILWNNSIVDLFECTAQYSYVQDEIDNWGIVSYWKLDGNANDSVGMNDGTIYGATPTTGQIGGALSFDGVNDYVNIGDKDSLEQQSFTLTFWSQNNFPSQDLQGGIAKGKIFGNIYEYSYKFQFRTQKAEAMITNTNDQYFWVSAPLYDSEWHMWTMTAGGGTLAIYRDGDLQESVGYTGTIDYTKIFNNFTIGAYTDGKYSFNGKIDDIAFFNSDLSVEEIEEIYDRGLAGQGLLIEPMFADAAGGDYHLLSERGRYRPSTDEWILDDVTSPCVDGGDPNIEPSNERMPNGSRINMGAYGNTAYASMSEWLIRGDFNFDGICNMKDMAIFAEEWMEQMEWRN